MKYSRSSRFRDTLLLSFIRRHEGFRLLVHSLLLAVLPFSLLPPALGVNLETYYDEDNGYTIQFEDWNENGVWDDEEFWWYDDGGMDSDGDGMSNNRELAWGTNPYCPDTDGDGINDRDELDLLGGLYEGYDPREWDTNGNGYSDHDEAYGYYEVDYNANGPGDSYFDWDGDGIKNVDDSHPFDSALWNDRDNNGTNDHEEYEDPYDPTVTDTDGDGVFDDIDSHPSDVLLWNDWNDDGYNDDWEQDFYGDVDNDGHYNGEDSHPLNPALWSDWDNDGYNEWDPYADYDADGYQNDNDSHPYDPHLWEDWNDNGINDGDEDPGEPAEDCDGDGYDDNNDSHPWDSALWEDWDYDGVNDSEDSHPANGSLWEDWNNSGTNDSEDDTDGDGHLDSGDSHSEDSSLWSDWDNDGLNEEDEISDSTNPYAWDTDDDGLSDGEEKFYKTNPLVIDSDGDGLTDYDELSGYTSPINGRHLDPNHPFSISPLYLDYLMVENADSDQDGIPDAIENFYGLNPASATDALGDLDADGITNLQEYLNGTSLTGNMAAYDYDRDGITDIQEDFWNARYPGILNKYSFSDSVEDPDGDGVLNFEEVKYGLNPNDNTTYGTLADLSWINQNDDKSWAMPVAAGDTDGDGLPDAWEHRYSLDIRAPGTPAEDPDTDGLTNLQEYQLGSHPLIQDAESKLVIRGNGYVIGNGQQTPNATNHTDFGTTSFPSGALVRTFTIQSTGNLPLAVSSVSVSGVHASEFSVGGITLPTTILAGASQSFTVSFLPTGMGIREAGITVTSNATDDDTHVFSVRAKSEIVFSSGTQTPITYDGNSLTNSEIHLRLNHIPVPGTNLEVLKNIDLEPINGTYSNLTQGQEVELTYGYNSYFFVANYYGGNGGDLVLHWANTLPFAWGNNTAERLGTNTTDHIFLPTPVFAKGGHTLSGKTVISIASGGAHTLALLSDGTVASWGNNIHGQLGNNSKTSRSLPGMVSQGTGSALLGKKVVAIAAGNNHSLALCSDGTLAAWGDNFSRQVGNGATTAADCLLPTPVDTSPESALYGKTVVRIASGPAAWHSMALCSDGTLVAWGRNNNRCLGHNSSAATSNIPVEVIATGALAGKEVVGMAAGLHYSLALCADSTMAAWGLNGAGRLGNGTTTQSAVPVSVTMGTLLSGDRTITQIAAGATHSLALRSDGKVLSWGDNTLGKLGINSTTDKHIPQDILAAPNTGTSSLIGKTVTGIRAGEGHSYAVCSDGSVHAWGKNAGGQLGKITETNHSKIPVESDRSLLSADQHFISIDSGKVHGMALVASPQNHFTLELPDGTVLAHNDTFDFGQVFYAPGSFNQTSEPQFILRNRGNANVTDLNLKAYPAMFEPTSPSGSTLTPGQTSVFKIKFNPSKTGSHEGTLQVSRTDSFGESVFWINLTGTSSNSLPAVYNHGNEIPLTGTSLTATGKTADVSLGFVPQPNTRLKVVEITGEGFIQGHFVNLIPGSMVTLTHNGVDYEFFVNYSGGTGNDLVLEYLPFDTVADSDMDGSDNLQEYLFGTSPHNKRSFTLPVQWTSSNAIGNPTVGSLIKAPGTGDGWNSRAVSDISIAHDGRISFSVLPGSSLALGLGPVSSNPNPSPNPYDMSNAIVVDSSDTARVYHQGVMMKNLGHFDSTTLFTIQRSGNTVEYLKNRSVVYTHVATHTPFLQLRAVLNSQVSQITQARLYTDDLDGDGMSDAWEYSFLDSGGVEATWADVVLFTPAADADEDGLTNLQEYNHVTDPGDPAKHLTAVHWEQHRNATSQPGNLGGLKKTIVTNPPWDAGAISRQKILKGSNGKAVFRFSMNKEQAAGLSAVNVDASQISIPHAIVTSSDNIAWVCEFGTFKYNLGSYTSDTYFAIDRTDNVVRYYKDNKSMIESSTESLGMVFIDTSFSTFNGEILEAFIQSDDHDGDQMKDDWEREHLGEEADLDDLLAFLPEDDADGDGLSNYDEFSWGTDPYKTDSDGDDLPDGWEVMYGTYPNSKNAELDSDGDGWSNLAEWMAGTHPKLWDSQPSGTPGPGGNPPAEWAMGSGSPDDPPANPSSFNLSWQHVYKAAQNLNYGYSNFRPSRAPNFYYSGYKKCSNKPTDTHTSINGNGPGMSAAGLLSRIDFPPFEEGITTPIGSSLVAGSKLNWKFIDPDHEGGSYSGIYQLDLNGTNEMTRRIRLKSSKILPVGHSVTVIPVLEKRGVTAINWGYTTSEEPTSTHLLPAETFEIPPGHAVSEARQFKIPDDEDPEEDEEVRIKLLPFDIFIDSDNNDGFNKPQQNMSEREARGELGNDEKPGKVILINDGDLDGDSIPDYADGYDLNDAIDEDATSENVAFVPVTMHLTPLDWTNAKVQFQYPASDPANVIATLDDPFVLPEEGKIRLWMKNGDKERKKEPVDEEGDYIKPGTPYSLSDLGLTLGQSKITLYVEAVRISEQTADIEIKVELDPTGTMGYEMTDAVRLTATRVEILARGANETAFSRSDRLVASTLALDRHFTLEPLLQGALVGGAEGEAYQTQNGYLLSNEGSGIGGMSDEFTMAYFVHGGDFDIATKLEPIIAPPLGAKAGLMVRNSTGPDAAFGMVAVDGGGNCIFEYRDETGEISQSISGGSAGLQPWLRLAGQNGIIRAYKSTDGQNWQQIGNGVQLETSQDFLLGMCLTSGDNSTTATAEFTNLTIPLSSSTYTVSDDITPGAYSTYKIRVHDPRQTGIDRLTIDDQEIMLTSSGNYYESEEFICTVDGEELDVEGIPETVIYLRSTPTRGEYNPPFRWPWNPPVPNGPAGFALVADLIDQAVKAMESSSWAGTHDGSFGNEVHSRVGAALTNKPGWLVDVYIDDNTKQILSIGQGPGALNGTTQIDLLHLKPGYRPQVGQILDPSKVENLFDIKTSLSGYVDRPQRQKLTQAMGGRQIVIAKSPKRWTLDKGWHINKKYAAGFRILSLFALGGSVWTVLNYDKHDDELDKLISTASEIRLIEDEIDKKNRSIIFVHEIHQWLAKFSPETTSLAISEMVLMYGVIADGAFADID
jgi:alpha-tubulin suppressor-like RCC1 family protein